MLFVNIFYLNIKHNLGGVAGQELSVASPSVASDEQASDSSEFRLPSRPPSISSAPYPSQPTTGVETDRPHRSRSPRERVSRLQRPSETRKTAGASDVEERLLSVHEAPSPPPQTVLDECHHFALSLVPLLNMMDFEKRQETKIHILQYISNQLCSTRQATGPQLHHPPHPPSTFPTATISPLSQSYRPITHPTPKNPLGHFSHLMASNVNPEWEERSSPYTDL